MASPALAPVLTVVVTVVVVVVVAVAVAVSVVVVVVVDHSTVDRSEKRRGHLQGTRCARRLGRAWSTSPTPPSPPAGRVLEVVRRRMPKRAESPS